MNGEFVKTSAPGQPFLRVSSLIGSRDPADSGNRRNLSPRKKGGVMNARVRWCASMLGVAVCVGAVGSPTRAQVQEKQQHVVTLGELNKQTARPAATRQANEDAVRHLLSSDAGQKALKSANVEYQRIDKAIGQLSDEELAKLAGRSR